MTRDEIIRMAREAGFSTLLPEESVDSKGGVYTDNDDEISERLKRFAELVAEAEIRRMVADGWRQCAAGQKTTQHCGLLEEAVAAERERCAKLCEKESKSIQHRVTDVHEIYSRGE